MKEFDFLNKINDPNAPLDEIAAKIPAFLHLNRISDLKPIYLDPKLKAFIGHENKNIDEIIKNAFNFVHADDLQPAIDANLYYLDNLHDYKTISFIQRIFSVVTKSYHPFYTTAIFIKSRNCLANLTMSIGGISSLNKPIDTLLTELTFAREKVGKWIQLSSRELEMVKHWVNERDNEQLAEILGISLHSVKSYKKRIYKKLEINQFSQLYRYAQAFEIL